MKRFVVFLLLLVPTIVAGEVLSVGGSLSLQQAPDAFADFWNKGKGVIVNIPFHQNDRGSLGFTVGLTRYSLNWNKLTGESDRETTSGGTIIAKQVGIYQKISFGEKSDRVIPFIRMGFSFYYTTASDLLVIDRLTGERLEQSVNSKSKDLLLDLGIGIAFRASESISIWMDGGYNHIFDSSWRIFPLQIGISISR